MKNLFLTVVALMLVVTSFAQKKILFDNTKSETASNADWIIDDDQPIPSPAQSGITSSSTEEYWQGALSSWGVEMVKRGYYVETLPSTGSITYNDASNAQDLSNYDIFIVCEPNNQFSSTEKQAMIDFVQNGGGLFIVSDHAVADRDGDGWDALEVWNDFFSSYSNPFGFTLDAGSNVSKDPATNVATLPSNPILHGAAGDVDGLAFYNGATFTIDNTANSSAVGLVFMDGYSNTGTTGVMAVCATYGNGRVVAVGDSSVPEDETAHDGSSTYPGWYQPYSAGDATGDDGVFMTNATIWLGESSTSPSLSSSPGSLSGFTYATGNGPSTSQSFSVSGSNLDGSQVTVTAPADYEISSDNSTFTSSISVSYTAPTLTSTAVYVRLKAGLSNGSYNESITVSDNGSATDINISLNGEVSSDVTILNEDFSTCPPSGWTIYSVTSSKDWTCSSQTMSANGYNGDVASDDWLISPAMDFSAYSSIILNFDTWTQYADDGISDPEVRMKYSLDYPGSGNPESYTWTELSYNFPAENSQTWMSSGDVDLSAISGTDVYIAFQYTSSGTGTGSSALWKVDNISVMGQVAGSEYSVSTSVNPASSGTATGSGYYSDGETVTLVASAATGYHFVNWTEGGNAVSTSVTYQFTATSDRSLVANFTLNSYQVTATVNPTSSGTVTGTGTYNYGETVTLVVSTAAGYHFINWTESGNVVSTSVTYQFTATSDRSLVANFALNSYQVTATVNPISSGIVTGTGTYNYGEAVTLTAVPNTDYAFTNWTESGSEVSTNASYTFTVTSDRALVANFEFQTSVQEVKNLSVNIYPNPSNGQFYVFVNNEIVKRLEISDITGQLILQSDIKGSETSVDITKYSKGIYFIRFIGKNNSVVKRIVKQ